MKYDQNNAYINSQSSPNFINNLYQYVLKILILEYINQPKFKQIAAFSSTYESDVSRKRNSVLALTSGQQNILNGEDESRLIEVLKQTLKNYLYDVTINQKKVDSSIFRRCLLKLNNDLFMDNSMESTLHNMSNAEDLIVYFTKAADNELKKLPIENVHEELYKQISNFVILIIEFLPKNTSTEYIKKLEEYKNIMELSKIQMKRRSLVFSQMRVSSLPTDLQSQNANQEAKKSIRKPTFVIDEIPYSDYFCKLFAVDKLVVQQDIIKLIGEASNFNICRDYTNIQRDLKNNSGFFTENDFLQKQSYERWKSQQLHSIDEFLVKFGTIGRASGCCRTENVIIPSNPRILLQYLFSLVLRLESINELNYLSFSQSGSFFIFKIAKYWLQDYPSTLSALLYASVNQNILKCEEINIPLMESMFNIIENKILKIQEGSIDFYDWSTLDIGLWKYNVKITAQKCFKTIDNLLSGLYAKTKPKFSSVLTFYYKYIDDDSGLYLGPEDVQMFKNTIFKTSEEYYCSLLESLPKKCAFTTKDFQNICELLIKEISSIQKKYTKPLLNKINIATECAKMLTSAVSVDTPLMVEQIQKSSKLKNITVSPVDALELYSVLKEIRNISQQVNSNENNLSSLESIFSKYLIKFSKNISKEISKSFFNALKVEKWEPLSDDVFYSSSVLDIFKMVNESLNLLQNFDWNYDYTYAYSITLLLQAFSDGIYQYCVAVTDIVRESLKEGSVDSNQLLQNGEKEELSTNQTNTWNFHALKNALVVSVEDSVPKAYKFNRKICTILNNIDMMITLLEKLETKIDPSKLSEVMNKDSGEAKKPVSTQTSMNIYTIRVKSANNIRGHSINGLSNSSVSIIYSEKRKTIGETIIYPNSNNPAWDQEFDLCTRTDSIVTLVFNVFHCPERFKLVRKNELCGRATLSLNSKEFVGDGLPTAKTLSLDTQGELNVEITLENEKSDPLFCIGKSYRTLSRTRNEILEYMVNKFTPFVNYTFSKEGLKRVCDYNGILKSTKNDIYSAVVPLFDYLNENLNILAQCLTQELLYMVMLKVWNRLLITVDALLLPQLGIAKRKLAHAKRALWNIGNNLNIIGYGRPLTYIEMEIVFIWLDALCVDFFYNNGEGPPLESLRNTQYQNLLLIPIYYDKSVTELKKEISRLTPLYFKYIDNLVGVSQIEFSRHLTTVRRRKTIMANSSKAKRIQYEKEFNLIEKSSQERAYATLNILLRILISKDELDYVYKQLHERKLKLKQININALVDQVSQGKKIRYKENVDL